MRNAKKRVYVRPLGAGKKYTVVFATVKSISTVMRMIGADVASILQRAEERR